MKTFNFKNIMFCLFLMTTLLGFLMTGCQKEKTLPEHMHSLGESEEIIDSGSSYLTLPEEIVRKENSEILSYLESLDSEEYFQLEEASRIKAFLESRSLPNWLNDKNLSFEKLGKIDLAYHLNTRELNNLTQFDHQEYMRNACDSGTYRHDWIAYCDSTTLTVKRCGDVYECENGQWELSTLDENVGEIVLCLYTDESCNPNLFCSSSGQTIGDQEYANSLVCEANPAMNRLFNSTAQELSLMASLGKLSDGGEKVQSMFIRNISELNYIFSSKEEKYRPVQKALKEFLLVNDFLLKYGLNKELGQSAIIGTPHINSLQNLTSELISVSESPKLKDDLGEIKTHFDRLNGKTLKTVITTLSF